MNEQDPSNSTRNTTTTTSVDNYQKCYRAAPQTNHYYYSLFLMYETTICMKWAVTDTTETTGTHEHSPHTSFSLLHASAYHCKRHGRHALLRHHRTSYNLIVFFSSSPSWAAYWSPHDWLGGDGCGHHLLLLPRLACRFCLPSRTFELHDHQRHDHSDWDNNFLIYFLFSFLGIWGTRGGVSCLA